MGRFIDLTGQKFGRLTVLERAGSDKKKNATWRCKCDCGKEKVIIGESIRHGKTTSCGCILAEFNSNRLKTHGSKPERLYRIWCGMMTRCYNQNTKRYTDYGGRGIQVCEEWKQFEVFRDWAIKSGYSEHLTIDRIDVNGNYHPTNCRWATMQEQANNTRRNHRFEYNGETHTLSEWARILNIPRGVIKDRLRLNWPIEKALTEPIKAKKRKL